MRSRSSRFFIVLLHLVGVTMHLPSAGHHHHHHQTLPLLSSSSSLPVASSLERNIPNNLFYFWIEDDIHGSCLGPHGYFSTCSDTTLWTLLKRPTIIMTDSSSSSSSSSSSPTAESTNELAIQYVDWDMYHPDIDDPPRDSRGHQHQHHNTSPMRQTQETMQCLTYHSSSLILNSCSLNQAWKWNWDATGRIIYSTLPTTHHHHHHIQHIQPNRPLKDFSWIQSLLLGPFLWYNHNLHDNHRQQQHTFASSTRDVDTCNHIHRDTTTNVAVMSPCPMDTEHKSFRVPTKIIPLSVVHSSIIDLVHSFSPSPSSSPIDHHTVYVMDNINSQASSSSNRHITNNQLNAASSSDGIISSSHTTSHIKADGYRGPHLHPDLKYPSNLLFSKVGGRQTLNRSKKKISFSISDLVVTGKTTDSILPQDRETNQDNSHDKSIIHNSQDHYSAPLKTRKIPMHPYLQTALSKNGLYEDPRTGLLFYTDLCPYLGYDKYTHGRQTLMGMGHYYRTLLKIKVYGVALYVSKRDVLADPFFIPFASISAKELTQNDRFYEYLYSDNRKIERTLLLKMNIQITVNSMRTSLEADWKLLSPEHKAALIESSFKKRDADQNMLKTIQSPNNPSRCSCGQSAPDIFKADPTCCSRGTVMSFTWLKNGDMELRIDGRVMDTFSSPGMAQGIFHEYLRGDDPISSEARNNFAEGFPFLLAPLSKVEISSITMSHQQVLYSQETDGLESSWIASAVSAIGNTIFSMACCQRLKLLSWFEYQFTQAINKFVQLTISLKQYREQESDHFGVILQSPFQRNPEKSSNSQVYLSEFQDDLQIGIVENSRHLPSITIPVSDELSLASPRAKTTLSRRIFIITVHFYLLLLLIVSIPDSFPTKVIVTKKSPQLSSIDSESDNDERNDDHFEDDDSIHSMNSIRLKHFGTEDLIADISQTDHQDEVKKPMPKAFSYCL